MGRTPLFRRLRRIAREIFRSHGPGLGQGRRSSRSEPVDLDRAWQDAGIERREFVKLTLGALGVAAAPGLLAACGDNLGPTPDAGPPDAAPPDAVPSDGGPPMARVIVVGAGLAGIHCAYRLRQAGVRATVYDAADRIGGRTFTTPPMFPDQQIAELGGELIDSNHATMFDLASELDLTLDDRFAGEPPGFVRDLWWANGAQVPEATIVEQFTAVAPALMQVFEMAEGSDEGFEMADNVSLADWLDENVPPAQYPALHAVLTSAYRGEFGLEPEQQSLLNLVYLIDFETPDPFRIFGDSDERYHTHEGNDSYGKRMAATLEADQIRLEHRLTGLHDAAGGAYRVVFTRPDDTEVEVEADHVVLALPFTQLRKVEITVADFSAGKREVIDELGYGHNTKVMGSFETRIWREMHDASGNVTSDLPMQQTWDTSIGQQGTHGLLTNFLGANQSDAAGTMDAETWVTSVLLPDLDQVFPGAAEQYVPDTAVMFHWPGYPFVEGSYTCYRPGQWRFWGTEGVRERNVHFCGEHCSVDFQGWMEGAAETGSVVAVEVLDDLGMAPAASHQGMLAYQLAAPHPCFHGDRARHVHVRPRFHTHRALAAARMAARAEALRTGPGARAAGVTRSRR
jgi:monoamine oxidase